MRRVLRALPVLLAMSVESAFAQVAASVTPSASVAPAQDSIGFTVVHAGDTVAVERFARVATELRGTLILPTRGHERTLYHATVLPDGTSPLIELSLWRGDDPENSPARQQTRVIFKDDSVAVDDITSRGMTTLVLPTSKGAIPYLNLSFAFLEQALLRAHALGGDSASVPFFSLGGGQTKAASIRRIGSDSAEVTLGSVEFRLRVDAEGHILGGGVPAQQLTVMRNP
ncbi:MAG: hypothetical protein ABJD11_13950 [Gemmatimonadota bacterium]